MASPFVRGGLAAAALSALPALSTLTLALAALAAALTALPRLDHLNRRPVVQAVLADHHYLLTGRDT